MNIPPFSPPIPPFSPPIPVANRSISTGTRSTLRRTNQISTDVHQMFLSIDRTTLHSVNGHFALGQEYGSLSLDKHAVVVTCNGSDHDWRKCGFCLDHPHVVLPFSSRAIATRATSRGVTARSPLCHTATVHSATWFQTFQVLASAIIPKVTQYHALHLTLAHHLAFRLT